MSDIGASILARLQNKAKAAGMPYSLCLQLFFQEEFLRRLSRSKYTANLILKGGLFIYTLTRFESRATMDIDLLLSDLSSDTEHMSHIMAEIIATPTGNNDVVILIINKIERILRQSKYPGVSTQIIGHIKNVRIPFAVDVGAGDIVIPKAQRRLIQPQLDGFDAPSIFTYSLESTIAEKFDAILQRLELTSRMKDFYDIFYLSQAFNFNGNILQKAIIQTLGNRGTFFERDSFDKIVALSDDTDLQTRWRYFLRTIKGRELAFTYVVEGIDLFLRPVWNAIINEGHCMLIWNCSERRWSQA
jgi:predicted nucleotidyltransferase component of viral defense system